MSRAKVIKVFIILFMLCMISSSGFADQNPINSEEEYKKHIKLAKEYSKEGQWDEAIEEYTNAISLKPDNAYLYYARGITYLLKADQPSGDPSFRDNAVEDFTKAIKLEPNNAVFYFFRSITDTVEFSELKNKYELSKIESKKYDEFIKINIKTLVRLSVLNLMLHYFIEPVEIIL